MRQFILLLLLPFLGFSQNCIYTIKGHITDQGTGEPIAFANIFVSETQKGAVSDQRGFFLLEDMCSGDFHITLSHIGCDSKQIFIKLQEKDVELDINMKHSVHELNDVILSSKSEAQTTQKIEIINAQYIHDNAGKNLASIAESVVGVSVLKNGSGISKPIVNGLFGNRLSILNNGIPQSGQQWGNDHSPEIDPLVANKIKVIKGTAGLEYIGATLGGTISVEPENINKEPHLHGKVNYFFQSNGLSNGVNFQLQQFPKSIGWKVNATFKRSGDLKTPDYFLTNTGIQEANLSLQLEKEISKKVNTDFYFSTFNTKLGILRGSQIGNTSDLQRALTSTIPQFTENKINFTIDAPNQKVSHHLAKIRTNYAIDFSQNLNFTVAAQLNQREEFDVRRSGRSDIPSLSLDQFNVFFESKYSKRFSQDLYLKSGVQFNFIDNKNQPETGIPPLIPDYISFQTGVFTTLSKVYNKSTFEAGIRYDNISQNAATITRTNPPRIARFQNSYHNISTSTGWNYAANEHLSFFSNLGYSMRNPAINELYSSGLHQGVSALEFGDPDLKNETAFKTTLGFKGDIKEKLSFEAHGYFQKFNDFIFLNPQGETRVTIRGSFLVFEYDQTDAQIYGLDFMSVYQITRSIAAKASISLIKAENTTDDIPLINIPTNNFTGSLTYEYPKKIALFGTKQLENFKLSINNQYVSQSKTVNEEFRLILGQANENIISIAPPKAYYLLGLDTSTDIQFKKTRLRITGQINNILNTAYRNYLNRQRYFADDLGINAAIGLSLKF